MPEAVIEKLRPLWDEAVQAFLSDPSYAVEMASAGAASAARKPSR